MEAVYEPEAWGELFLMIGTCAGALVGLLFIVMSLHLDRIRDQSDANVRASVEGARFNILHLLTVMVESAVILAPQPLPFMAVELILINLFGLRLPFTIIARYANKHLTISEQGGFPTVLLGTIIIAYLMGAGGGAALFVYPWWGLWFVTLACLIKIVRSVLTAWLLMFSVLRAAPEKRPAPRRRKAG